MAEGKVRLTSAQKKAVSAAVSNQVLTGGCPNLNVVDRLAKTGVHSESGQRFRVSVGYTVDNSRNYYYRSDRRQEVKNFNLLVVDGEVYVRELLGSWEYQGKGEHTVPDHFFGSAPEDVKRELWEKWVRICDAMQDLVDQMITEEPTREESELAAHKRDLQRARSLQRRIKACFYIGGFEMDTPVDIDTTWAYLTDARNVIEEVISELEHEIIPELEEKTANKVHPV